MPHSVSRAHQQRQNPGSPIDRIADRTEFGLPKLRRLGFSPALSAHGEHMHLPRLLLLGAALVLAGPLAACAVPVAAGLDESDANRIVVALDRASVDAVKEIDPGAEGKFRVVVPRDDAAHALSAMRDEELPRPRPAGLLDAMDKGALVPSRAAEHAQMVAGLGGDLERTLEAIDGVLAARVHLNLPSPDPLRDVATPKSTASVLLEHRGSTPPLTIESVQRLVSGGVGGLAPQDVAVVLISRTAPPNGPVAHLAHVGPIAVAPASVRTLQAALVGLIALVAVLAGATLLLYTRLARLRAEQVPK
jgi:type III secretion protein J